MTKTVVGLYDSYQDAESTVHDLIDSGFQREDVSFIAQDATHGNQPSMRTGEDVEKDSVADGAAAGAGTGAVLGGLAGLLIGLGALAIPGVGPIIAAGPLASALAGAGIGVVAGGLIGALVDAGVPKEHAQAYAEGVQRGGTLVTVKSPDDRAEMARDIMNRHHPIDITDRSRTATQTTGTMAASDVADTRASTGQPTMSSGQSTMDTVSPGYSSNMSTNMGTTGGAPENTASTDFSQMGRGTATEGPMAGDESIMDRERRMDQAQRTTNYQGTGFQGDQGAGYRQSTSSADMGTSYQGGAFQGDQGADYQRGIREGEQQDLSGVGHGDWETRDVNSIVSGTSQDQGQTMRQHDFSAFNQDFRNHYTLVYAARGYEYSFYEPGYRYGYDVANSDQYQGRKWSEIEPELQRNWLQTNPDDPWEDFRDAVRYAWERASSMPGTGGQDTSWSGSQDYGTGRGTTMGSGYDPNNP